MRILGFGLATCPALSNSSQLVRGVVVADLPAMLANPVVARLAAGDMCPDSFCGLVVVCNWPASAAVQRQHDTAIRAPLAALSRSAYVYPSSSLHCTIATLRAFTAGPLDRASEVPRWAEVLDAAARMPSWPRGHLTLRMRAPTFEGAAGVVRYEEISPGGKIAAMRACLVAAIASAGGAAAIGGGDRGAARALPSARAGEPGPHVPDIIHSTVLRWAAEPSAAEVAAVRAAFERIASTWVPVECTLDVSSVCAVCEDTPYMHLPPAARAQNVFWEPCRSRWPRVAPAALGFAALAVGVAVVSARGRRARL